MAMTDEEILALLKKMIEENDDFEEKDITFFEIIDKSDKETLISRMLAYTLKKDEGLAGKLIKYASKDYLNAGNNSFEDIVVTNIRCEKSLPGGRIDIFVEAQDSFGHNYTLTIENKIESEEHGKQTQRYFDYIERNYKKSTNRYLYLIKTEYSSCVCKEFMTITYKDLESLIEDKGDGKIADFKNHIKKYFCGDIKMKEVYKEILGNYKKLTHIMAKADKAYDNEKKSLFSVIVKELQVKENGWQTDVHSKNGEYYIYKEDWYHDDKDSKKKFYFYVELLYVNNDPNEICVQGTVKTYGSDRKNCDIEKFVRAELDKEVIEKGRFYIFYQEIFSPLNPLYSEEWKNELKEFAMEHIRKAIAKINEVFTSFKSYEERVDK